jgi:hypothetical protein
MPIDCSIMAIQAGRVIENQTQGASRPSLEAVVAWSALFITAAVLVGLANESVSQTIVIGVVLSAFGAATVLALRRLLAEERRGLAPIGLAGVAVLGAAAIGLLPGFPREAVFEIALLFLIIAAITWGLAAMTGRLPSYALSLVSAGLGGIGVACIGQIVLFEVGRDAFGTPSFAPTLLDSSIAVAAVIGAIGALGAVTVIFVVRRQMAGALIFGMALLVAIVLATLALPAALDCLTLGYCV